MEITQIKAKLTLSEVLQHYGLKPDKHLRLHCPFHADKTPSLQVYYKTHSCYCFSANCPTHGKSLDVIDFIELMDKSSKGEAIRKAEGLITGTVHPAVQLTRVAVLTKMFTYFRNAVHNSAPAREYLQQRSLDHTQLEIGYNTGQFHHGSRKEEALIKSCIKVGLLSETGSKSRSGGPAYKPFAKYSVVFALRNRSGQVAGLYFRSTINDSKQRHFYLKDRQGLYPRYPKPETEWLVLTESIIDAASLLQQEAITKQYSILSLFGTNGLTEEHRQAIQELTHLKEIIFFLNGDEAGRKATANHAKTLRQLKPEVKLSGVAVPDGEDVNSLLQSHEPTVLTHLLDSRTTLTEGFFLSPENTPPPPATPTPPPGTADCRPAVPDEKKNEVIESNPTPNPAPASSDQPKPQPAPEGPKLSTRNPYKLLYQTATAHYAVLGGVSKVMDAMKVTLQVEHPVSRRKSRNKVDLYEDRQLEKLAKEVADKLDLPEAAITTELYMLTDLLDEYRNGQLQNSEEANKDEVIIPALTAQERNKLEAFLRAPDLMERLSKLLGQSGIVGEEQNRLFLFLVAFSHKLPHTLHALIQGSSGSGKTRLLKQIAACMPPESTTKLTRISDKVLYNYPEHYFVNRLMCLEDIDGLGEEAEFAFRELQSNGELNSATSIKLENGQITSGQKTVRGPIASLCCTTRGEVYEDNMGRCFLIAVDESSEQTSRVISYQNQKAAGQINEAHERKVQQSLQQVVRILQPLDVVNPYAHRVRLPEEAHKIRRLNELFQSFIKIITLLHQYQRKKDERGQLISTLDDIEQATRIIFESILLKVDELDGSLRQFYEKLKRHLQQRYNGKHQQAEFTRFEVREATGVGKTQQHSYLRKLLALEYLQQYGHANRGYKYKVVHWDNYAALRQRIQSHLQDQIDQLKTGKGEHPRTPDRTPEESQNPVSS